MPLSSRLRRAAGVLRSSRLPSRPTQSARHLSAVNDAVDTVLVVHRFVSPEICKQAGRYLAVNIPSMSIQCANGALNTKLAIDSTPWVMPPSSTSTCAFGEAAPAAINNGK